MESCEDSKSWSLEERQMYDDLDRMDEESTHFFDIIWQLFNSEKEIEHEDLIWGIYRKTITCNSIEMDATTWKIGKSNLPYPKSFFCKCDTLIQFVEINCAKYESSISDLISKNKSDHKQLFKALILIKLLSLAIRRYPCGINQEQFDQIQGNSHWIFKAAKVLIKINSGSEGVGSRPAYGVVAIDRFNLDTTLEQMKEMCSNDVDVFFAGASNARVFWVPRYALLFDNLAKTFNPNKNLITFINNHGYRIRFAFYPLRK